VIALIARQSMHMSHDQSFLGTNSTGMAQDERDSRTYPLFISSSTCLSLNLLCFFRICMVCWSIQNVAPGTKSIWCSIPRIGEGRVAPHQEIHPQIPAIKFEQQKEMLRVTC
jgi:hypothetical protein